MWAETNHSTTAHHPQHGYQTPRLYIWGLCQYSLCEIQEKKKRNHPLKSIASGNSDCDSGEHNPQERLKSLSTWGNGTWTKTIPPWERSSLSGFLEFLGPRHKIQVSLGIHGGMFPPLTPCHRLLHWSGRHKWNSRSQTHPGLSHQAPAPGCWCSGSCTIPALHPPLRSTPDGNSPCCFHCTVKREGKKNNNKNKHLCQGSLVHEKAAVLPQHSWEMEQKSSVGLLCSIKRQPIAWGKAIPGQLLGGI